ncbi:hypothetical protein MASR2M70_11710 [Bacillota bacterium]
MFVSQNIAKQTQIPRPKFPHTGIIFIKITFNAEPPIHIWIPNQPPATMALKIAGIVEPENPKAARQYTGDGTPNFCPACPFKYKGINKIKLASKIVAIACNRFIPPINRPDAKK